MRMGIKIVPREIGAHIDFACDVFHVVRPPFRNVEVATTVTGLLHWPDAKSAMIVFRSVRSTSISPQSAPETTEVVEN